MEKNVSTLHIYKFMGGKTYIPSTDSDIFIPVGYPPIVSLQMKNTKAALIEYGDL